MSKKDKDVKVSFHTLIQKHFKKENEDNEKMNPFFEILDLINEINALSKVKRFYNLKDNKFCFMDSIEITETANYKLVTGFIKSARNEFRPNLIDKKTGNERKNPKTLNEGDIEKTHFCIRVDESEVMFFLQSNYYGISVLNFINYLKEFERNRLKKIKSPMNYGLTYSEIMRNNFLTVLENMNRVKTTELFIDKQFLASDSLNISNRIMSIQKEIKVVVNANKFENIKEFAIDSFNKISGTKDKSIVKIRVIGNDNENNDVILDTSFFNMIEFINVDLNLDTGEINTTQMITGLKKIANSY